MDSKDSNPAPGQSPGEALKSSQGQWFPNAAAAHWSRLADRKSLELASVPGTLTYSAGLECEQLSLCRGCAAACAPEHTPPADSESSWGPGISIFFKTALVILVYICSVNA